MFKRKSKTGTSPVASTGSALAGLNFKGAGGSKAAAAPTTSARPSWNTSLAPDAKGSANAPFPAREGVAFLDCRVSLAPQKELGYLLVALGKANIRPVLVPSVLKIVGTTIKEKGKHGVLGDRAVVEQHIKAALDSVGAPANIVADFNPALDMSWIDEKRYELPAKVEENIWLALVNGIDEKPGNGTLEKAGKAPTGKQTPEAAKQTSDRLTIINEIVSVCNNTKGPHLLFTTDSVIESSAVADFGGPDLGCTVFDMDRVATLGLKSTADGDAAVQRLLTKVQQGLATSPAPVAPRQFASYDLAPDEA